MKEITRIIYGTVVAIVVIIGTAFAFSTPKADTGQYVQIEVRRVKEMSVEEYSKKMNEDFKQYKNSVTSLKDAQKVSVGTNTVYKGEPSANNGGTYTEVYNPNNILQRSNLSKKQFKHITRKLNLSKYSEQFINAERAYGINALFLIALAKLESADGTSNIAIDKHNLFGFTAYDRNPYENATTFLTEEICIYHVADYLKKNYLTQGGDSFNGYAIYDINKRYSSATTWATTINLIIDTMLRNSL